MPNGIKIVFCDIGGVLLEIDPERTVALWAEKAGVSPDHIRSRFPLDVHHQYERGTLSDTQFYTQLVRIMETPSLTREDFRRGWLALIGKETGFWTVLRQTIPDLPVWLLSNTNPLHIQSGLADRFSFFNAADGTIFSYAVHMRKPEAGIFHWACQTAGVVPEQALFIDDVEENIFAARTLGMQTIHYRDLATSERALREKVISRA